MKIKNSNNKKKQILICVAVAIVLVVAIALGVYLISTHIEEQEQEKANNTVTGISIHITPKTEYLVGQEIDFTGLKIQLITSAIGNLKFVEYPNEEMSITGYDMSVAGKQTVTVTYQGFSTTYKINVKEPEPEKPTLVSVEVCDMPTTYSRTDWNEGGPIIKSAYLKLTYSDGTVIGSYNETPLRYEYIEPYDVVQSGEYSTTLTITYIEGGISVSTTVTITITN